MILLLICTFGYSQTTGTLTLDLCWSSADENYPETKQKGYLKEILELKIKNLQTTWLPKADLFVQASYQSDAISFDTGGIIPGLSFPEQPKDQMKVGVEFQQVIYDGGLSQAMKKIEVAAARTKEAEIDIHAYLLKKVITDLYFGILINRANGNILSISLEELMDRLFKAESSVRNGILPESALLHIQIEIHRLKQRITSQHHFEKEMIDKLAELTGLDLGLEVVLQLPSLAEANEISAGRPELEYFASLKKNIEVNAKLRKLSRYPRATAFAQAGYGRPALNMLSDEFDAYYLAGLRLGWSLFDWKQTQRDQEVLFIQKQIIDNKIELFEQQTRMNVKAEMASIAKLSENLEEEKRIVRLYEKLLETSESRMNEGVIHPSDYLRDFNALMESKIQVGILEKQLMKARIMYQFELGSL
jgi:outer membrane protein TolC